LRQAKRVADYVIFIYFGEVLEQGPAKEVFNHPKHPQTKAYLEGEIG
jgi:phosphate transport system ATP-binding protein